MKQHQIKKQTAIELIDKCINHIEIINSHKKLLRDKEFIFNILIVDFEIKSSVYQNGIINFKPSQQAIIK